MSDQDPEDDRLASYIRQRADVPIPAGLLAGAQAAHPASARRTPSWARLALGAMTLAVGVFLIGARLLQATPLPPAGQPSPAVGSTADGFPLSVLGLPVRSVADVRALIAGGGHQGRALAVGGWWSEAVIPMGCPAPMVYRSAVEGYCSEVALAPTDATIDDYRSSADSTSESFRAPKDALLPRKTSDTAGAGEPWKGVAFRSAERLRPQRVVLIGHVGDPRAWMCAAATFQSCKSEFVVDAFAWVEGRPIDAWNDRGGVPTNLGLDAARGAVEAAVPGGRLSSLSVWTNDDDPSLDPRIPLGAGTFWIAHVIAGPPDPQGSAALQEVLIDDKTGTAQILPMQFAAGSEPGSVQFTADGDFYNHVGELPSLYAAIIDGSSRRLQQTYLQSLWNTPAVLPAGDYRVVSWTGDANARVVNPSPPSQVSCSGPVHVVSNAIVSITITWDQKPSCSIRAGDPTPSAGP